MKKILSFFISVFFVQAVLCATDINEMISKAQQSSSQYANIELSLQSSLNTYYQRKLTNQGMGITVNLGNSAVLENDKFYVPKLSMTFTLPEKVKGLLISANASITGKNPMNTGIDPEKGAVYTAGAQLTWNKTFEFSNIEVEDISDVQTVLQVQMNYEKSKIQFENSLIQDVISIMQLENQIKTSKKSYDKSLKLYQNSLLLGDIKQDSVTDLNQKMALETTRITIESSEERLEVLKQQFEHNYSIAYEPVTQISIPEIEFTEDENGNSSVYLTYLSMLSTKKNLDNAMGDMSSLAVNASLTPVLTYNGDKADTSISASAGVSYSMGKLNISSTFSSALKNGEFESPKLTISGSWGKNQASDLSKDSLNIAYLQAQSAYSDALYSYLQSAKSLKTSIESHKSDVSQLEVKIDYHTRILEAKQQLFDQGLCTENELEEAKTNLESDCFQMDIYNLQGLVLLNQIKMIEL